MANFSLLKFQHLILLANTKDHSFGVETEGFSIYQYGRIILVNKKFIIREMNQRKDKQINSKSFAISCAFE